MMSWLSRHFLAQFAREEASASGGFDEAVAARSGERSMAGQCAAAAKSGAASCRPARRRRRQRGHAARGDPARRAAGRSRHPAPHRPRSTNRNARSSKRPSPPSGATSPGRQRRWNSVHRPSTASARPGSGGAELPGPCARAPCNPIMDAGEPGGKSAAATGQGGSGCIGAERFR